MKLKLSVKKDNLIIILVLIIAAVLGLQYMQIGSITKMIEQKLDNPSASVSIKPTTAIENPLLLLGGCNLV